MFHHFSSEAHLCNKYIYRRTKSWNAVLKKIHGRQALQSRICPNLPDEHSRPIYLVLKPLTQTEILQEFSTVPGLPCNANMQNMYLNCKKITMIIRCRKVKYRIAEYAGNLPK